MGLPKLMPTRKVPVGANEEIMAGFMVFMVRLDWLWLNCEKHNMARQNRNFFIE
jgi:hypothetical protein